jgi:hypothetical protein
LAGDLPLPPFTIYNSRRGSRKGAKEEIDSYKRENPSFYPAHPVSIPFLPLLFTIHDSRRGSRKDAKEKLGCSHKGKPILSTLSILFRFLSPKVRFPPRRKDAKEKLGSLSEGKHSCISCPSCYLLCYPLHPCSAFALS